MSQGGLYAQSRFRARLPGHLPALLVSAHSRRFWKNAARTYGFFFDASVDP
jgi:hypothetical protein